MKQFFEVKKEILVLLFLLFKAVGFGQSDTHVMVRSSYTQMLSEKELLFAINTKGQLSIWDLTTLDKKFEMEDTSIHFSALASDKHGDVFLGTRGGEIFRYNYWKNSFELFLTLKEKKRIAYILFNSMNELFLIVPKAVYDPIKEEYWVHFKQNNDELFRSDGPGLFLMPEYVFMDSRDVLWMTSSFGEWGGTIQRFDSKNRRIINDPLDSLRYGLGCLRSVFEGESGHIYITTGLQHFVKSGNIYLVKNNVAQRVYDHEHFKDTTQFAEVDSRGIVHIVAKSDGGIFVGPGAYNKSNKRIYFASSEGFFSVAASKGEIISAQEFIFKPNLLWENEPLAIGVDMTIKKVDFTDDNRLLFLTSNNGIGIYDGDTLRMLK